MTDKELLQQALDALTKLIHEDLFNPAENAIEAIKARLAQPEPIPTNNGRYLTGYKAPPNKEWVGLTDEEIHLAYSDVLRQSLREQDKTVVFNVCRAIEAKLKEKNS